MAERVRGAAVAQRPQETGFDTARAEAVLPLLRKLLGIEGPPTGGRGR